MKQIYSLFLMIVVLGQAAVPAFWTLDYQFRRAVYLKNCENKANPSLHCDGKCYLKKRMTASRDKLPKAPELPGNVLAAHDLLLFCDAIPELSFSSGVGFSVRNLLPPYQRFCATTYVTRIFKPPAIG